MPTRTAAAKWTGTLKSGDGQFTLGSNPAAYDYSFKTRFEEDKNGTNPEELIAAAHASCFSMALAAGLEKAGFPAESVNTKAAVQLDAVDGGFTITQIALTSDAVVPRIDAVQFLTIAEETKKNCPVSKALASVNITLTAQLIG